MRLSGPRKGIKPSAVLSLPLFPPCIGTASLEFNGLGADEIKRRPEVETLLVMRDTHTEVMNKILNWLSEG
jgi:hypothetical protein